MDNMNEFSNIQQSVSAEKPRSKQPIAKVVAMIVAVAVVAGGAGFGGAYVAGRSGAALVDPSVTASESADESGAPEKDSADPSPEKEESGAAKPSLGELQAGATVQHNLSGEVEYNTDGTYMYTRDLVAAVRDTVVYIEVYTSYRGEEVLYGSGSGIVISADGYILTNAHVVDDMDKYTVQINDTDPKTGEVSIEKFDAVLIGSDTDTDLAILKIDATGLQTAVLGDSDELHLGDDCVVIGNPLGLETSVSKGIISGLNRQISSNQRSLSSIQTDAAINSGNSGGAMFNMYGEVVGVVNEKLVNNYAENVGFAITINEAKSVIDDLVSKGYVSGRAFLGINYLWISEYNAAVQGMTVGMYITDIDQKLAIADSDLKVGDTIIAINGITLTGKYHATELLKGMSPGDTVTATVVRTNSLGNNVKMDIDIVLSEYNGS